MVVGATSLAGFVLAMLVTRGQHVAAWIRFLIISVVTLYHGVGIRQLDPVARCARLPLRSSLRHPRAAIHDSTAAPMNGSSERLVLRNSVFAWLALLTGGVLLVPWLAMQLSAAVDWSAMDFLVMGALVFGAGCVFVLVARRVPRRHWRWVGAAVVAGFLYVWAELAVGVFTHLGS